MGCMVDCKSRRGARMTRQEPGATSVFANASVVRKMFAESGVLPRADDTVEFVCNIELILELPPSRQ